MTTTLREFLLPIHKWDPAKASQDDELDYIDLGSIDQDRKLIAETRAVNPSNAPSRARQLVTEGDVLVATVRPALNGVARVPPELDGAVASTDFRSCDRIQINSTAGICFIGRGRPPSFPSSCSERPGRTIQLSRIEPFVTLSFHFCRLRSSARSPRDLMPSPR